MTFISDEHLENIRRQMERENPHLRHGTPITSIYDGRIKITRVGNIGTIEILNANDWKLFQELVQRGANLWPDAPPQIKELADLVTNGKVMQDYFKQANATNVNNLPQSGETK